MLTVFIDTNFFLLYLKRFNIFKKVRELVPGMIYFMTSTGVLQELKSINKKGIKLILRIIDDAEKNGNLKVIPSPRYVDEWLLKYIDGMTDNERCNLIVCTNDAELRKQLKRKNIKVISLKNESVIGFV